MYVAGLPLGHVNPLTSLFKKLDPDVPNFSKMVLNKVPISLSLSLSKYLSLSEQSNIW